MLKALQGLCTGLITAVLLIASTPASAATTTDPPTAKASFTEKYPTLHGKLDDTESIALFGDVPLNTDGSINLNAVEISLTDTKPVSPSSEGRESMVDIAAADYTIRQRWNDVRGWGVIVRAWQEDKIQGQHNVTVDVARAVTTNPDIGYDLDRNADGHTWIFRAKVNHVQCGLFNINCRVTESRIVRAVVSYRKLRDGESSGLISTYCENHAKCPDWVKNAINI